MRLLSALMVDFLDFSQALGASSDSPSRFVGSRSWVSPETLLLWERAAARQRLLASLRVRLLPAAVLIRDVSKTLFHLVLINEI